ncbi:hypothetical protein HYX58_03165 [Candidatus Dependentiae bacterium]|nr:hypothetical protein [Candidatus Dependentiae bacterium]
MRYRILHAVLFLVAASSMVTNAHGQDFLNFKNKLDTIADPSYAGFASYFFPIFTAGTFYSFYKALTA